MNDQCDHVWSVVDHRCGKCGRLAVVRVDSFCVTPGMLAETQRLLDLREQQLADCTRAMREASLVLREYADWIVYEHDDLNVEHLIEMADKLDAARAGKAGALG